MHDRARRSRVFPDAPWALESVNVVFRHGGPVDCIAGIEQVSPSFGSPQLAAFWGSAAVIMVRADRLADARALVARAALADAEGSPKFLRGREEYLQLSLSSAPTGGET